METVHVQPVCLLQESWGVCQGAVALHAHPQPTHLLAPPTQPAWTKGRPGALGVGCVQPSWPPFSPS
eukprot:1158773-Pelagomonas_calceolata.AAC.11